VVLAAAHQNTMPPLSQNITHITDLGSLSSNNGCEQTSKTNNMMASKRKSKQKSLLIASSSPPYVSSSSLSSAASALEGPGALSTSSDDSSLTPKDYIDVPGYLDICCGRGKGFFNRPGNKLFQDTIRENAECYRNAKSKSLKSAIVTSLVRRLTEQGARFVKKDPQANGRWYILSPSLAHEKTGHAIRDHWTQRQQQEVAAAASRPEEALPEASSLITDQESVSSASPRRRNERQKKSGGKNKRLHKKGTQRKIQKPTARRATKSDGKRGKTELVTAPTTENVEAMVVDSQDVLGVDSLPKLGMRHFHDVENGSISTISSCPHDHHLESFDFFQESPFLGEHHDHSFPLEHDGNTERENLSYVAPTSDDLWSQPHFLPGADANDSHSLVKQDVPVSHHQLDAMSKLVVDDKIDTSIAPVPTFMYNSVCYFPQPTLQSGLMQSMSKGDPSLMDAYFSLWFQQQGFVRTFGSGQFVENSLLMPNPLVSRPSIVQMGFNTGNSMNS
jgi:hypothetical protein